MRGTSMIEVLVTLVIVAIGLLGLAGLQSRLQISEMESYQRAQALILLNDMASRLAANRANAASYITPGPLGAGMTCPTSTATPGTSNCSNSTLASPAEPSTPTVSNGSSARPSGTAGWSLKNRIGVIRDHHASILKRSSITVSTRKSSLSW